MAEGLLGTTSDEVSEQLASSFELPFDHSRYTTPHVCPGLSL